MMGLWKGLFIYLIILRLPTYKGSQLNEYIKKYEVLKYSVSHVHGQHQRIKRSQDYDSTLGIHFNSHGRSFHLRLRRDTSTISPYAKVEIPADLGKLDLSHIYDGTLANEPNSQVWGSIREGVFEGVINSPSEGTFYVERAHKFFPNHNATHSGFHSVIYHDDHVVDPYLRVRSGHSVGCGVSGSLAASMSAVQNSALPSYDQKEFSFEEDAPNLTLCRGMHNRIYEDFQRKFSEEANARPKRSSDKGIGHDNRSTCSLSILTDPFLWRHIFSQEKFDREKTKDEITALISQHIKAINVIYGNVKFSHQYNHKGIRFEVQRIKIDDDTPCKSSQDRKNYHFCQSNVDVSHFLNIHSKTNHSNFCLAYVFTYRDFTGGTLGLAWVASPSGASGGICEKYKTYTENLGGIRQTEERSLNTGIITFLNYNSRVPPKVSQLTLAHEIGHNFGSPHDYPDSCKPGGLNGNYIMFSSATSGDRPNNSKFSQCSISNISMVLDAIVDGRRRNCFTVSNGAFCGNKIVEVGEECDCGYDDEECTEKCCYPRILSDNDRHRNASAKSCTRRKHTQCSPSEGPCCDSQCHFRRDLECHSETDCTLHSNCNGFMATCPKPSHKNNFTFCNEETKVCINGECSGSICLAHGMQECFLTSDVVTDKKKLCEIACLDVTTNKCKSTSELSHIFPGPVFMRPGAPCNNFQGYCDVFQKCRAVDAEGPLARLKNLLLNEETLNSISEWITIYWYYVLLGGVGFVILMGVFIKCCAIHTPSSNPSKRPARSFSQTLRHPVNTLRRSKHPHRRNPAHIDPRGSSGGPSHHQLHESSQPGPSNLNRGRRDNSAAQAARSSRTYTDEPPPPYPGARPPPTRHGYGEGRGHYNRPKGGRRVEKSAV